MFSFSGDVQRKVPKSSHSHDDFTKYVLYINYCAANLVKLSSSLSADNQPKKKRKGRKIANDRQALAVSLALARSQDSDHESTNAIASTSVGFGSLPVLDTYSPHTESSDQEEEALEISLLTFKLPVNNKKRILGGAFCSTST